MKTKIIYAFLSCMLLLAAACEDEVNNWPVDGSQDGLFRSLTFEEKKSNAYLHRDWLHESGERHRLHF